MSSSAAGEELAAILLESHKQFFTGSKRNRRCNGFPQLNVVCDDIVNRGMLMSCHHLQKLDVVCDDVIKRAIVSYCHLCAFNKYHCWSGFFCLLLAWHHGYWNFRSIINTSIYFLALRLKIFFSCLGYFYKSLLICQLRVYGHAKSQLCGVFKLYRYGESTCNVYLINSHTAPLCHLASIYCDVLELNYWQQLAVWNLG